MARFSQLSHTDGRVRLVHIDMPLWEAKLGAKVLLGAGLIGLGTYFISYPPVMAMLALGGIGVLIATSISTYLLLVRDVEAHRERTVTIPAMPYEVDTSDTTRTIPLNANGVTTQLTIDARDEALSKLILTILDVSIKQSSVDATTFLPYRQLGVRYVDYNSALMGLGSLVRRERGTSPNVVYPHTLGTVRAMFSTGNTLPFRQGASESANRVK